MGIEDNKLLFSEVRADLMEYRIYFSRFHLGSRAL